MTALSDGAPTTPPPTLNLEAIRERCEAATEGPWKNDTNTPFSGDLVGIFVPSEKRYVGKWADQGWDEDDEVRYADAEFIAAARFDVPALVAECESLRAKIAAVEAVVAEHCGPSEFLAIKVRAALSTEGQQ